MKNFIKISLIIKECPEQILIKLAIVLKISKSSWNTGVYQNLKNSIKGGNALKDGECTELLVKRVEGFESFSHLCHV